MMLDPSRVEGRIKKKPPPLVVVVHTKSFKTGLNANAKRMTNAMCLRRTSGLKTDSPTSGVSLHVSDFTSE